MEVNGRPLIWWALHRLREAGVDDVYVAVGATELDDARALLGDQAFVVAGGDDRVASVRAALHATTHDPEVFLVHDAARAFVPVEVIRRVIEAVRAGAGAVVPVLPVTDTMRRIDRNGRIGGVVDRDGLRIVQTPQGFSADVLRRAHAHAAIVGLTATDDAGLAEAIGVTVVAVDGDRDAFKITTAGDLEHARRLFSHPAADEHRAERHDG